jgi:magnesium chelatase family protein
VLAARARQRDHHGVENARLPAAALGAAGRGYHRALRVARTIADLAGEDRIADHHVREALGLRHLPLAPGDEPGAA